MDLVQNLIGVVSRLVREVWFGRRALRRGRWQWVVGVGLKWRCEWLSPCSLQPLLFKIEYGYCWIIWRNVSLAENSDSLFMSRVRQCPIVFLNLAWEDLGTIRVRPTRSFWKKKAPFPDIIVSFHIWRILTSKVVQMYLEVWDTQKNYFKY